MNIRTNIVANAVHGAAGLITGIIIMKGFAGEK